MQALSRYRLRVLSGRILIHLVVLFLALLYFIPLLFTISTAIKTPDQVFKVPLTWIPDPPAWENFWTAWTVLPFNLFLWNSVKVTFLSIIGIVCTNSLVGYGFARIRFKGREILFMVLLGTMMIPYQARMIPTFIIFKRLGWLNTHLPLIVPAFFAGSPFFVFLFRQFFRQIPYELDEAAKLDGCNNLYIFIRIMAPLSRAVFVSVMIFGFMQRWNDFWSPLIYLTSQSKFTMARALSLFKGEFDVQYHLQMAISTLMLLPCIVLFLIAQKYFVKGISMTGMKG